MQDGIYRMIRHPRYLSAGVGVVANALFINYAGLYILILLLVPPGHMMLVFEEREVPRLIPHWRKTRWE